MAGSERDRLRIIGAIGVTCAFPFSADELYGQHDHAGETPAAGPAKPEFFTAEEFELLSRLADLIIPPTETPGAVQAGVGLYIDQVVARNKQWQKLYREGLAWLAGKRFLSLAEPKQIALLKPLCEEADREVEAPAGSGRRRRRPLRREAAFFRAVKSMTADGYYTSQAGLTTELGYRGNTVLAEFPNCLHEH